MKKLAIVSSYCDNQDKKDKLDENISKLKKEGLDVLVISSIPIQVDCDFLYITKENPILLPDKKRISMWRTRSFGDKQIKLIQHTPDFGWASLYQIKKGLQIAQTYDYDKYYLLIYDLIMTDEIIDKINSDENNILFPRRDFGNKELIYPSSFHLTIFDKFILNELIKKIDFNDYCYNVGFAENFIDKWGNELNLKKSDLIVEDSINNTSSLTFFDYSKQDEYKFFLGENEQKEILLFFYDIKSPLEIKLNDNNYAVTGEVDLIKTNFFMEDISNFLIKCKDVEFDYTFIQNIIISNEIKIS